MGKSSGGKEEQMLRTHNSQNHVALCISGVGGLKYMAVTVISLLHKHPSPELVHLHIVWENLEAEHIASLRESWRGFEARTTFYRLSEFIGEEALDPDYGYWFRIWLAELLDSSIDKVLYLDYDMMIMDDITPLWDVEIEGIAAAVVWDPEYRKQGLSARLSFVARLFDWEFEADTPYFNSGMMMINLTWWREHDLARVTSTRYKKHRHHFPFWDQDELNLLLKGQVKAISPRWNLLEPVRLYADWDFEIYADIDQPSNYFRPAIRHFSGGHKPDTLWVRSSEKELFYQYIDRMVWSGWRSEHDRKWWSGSFADLIELHYEICRGWKQGVLKDNSTIVGLLGRYPFFPFLYLFLPFYRALLRLTSFVHYLKSLSLRKLIASESRWNHRPSALGTVIFKRLLSTKYQDRCLSLWKTYRKGDETSLAIPPFFQPATHEYGGYGGPWIEDAFDNFYRKQKDHTGDRVYIPLRWTDYYVRFGWESHAELSQFLDQVLQPERSYFTIVQHDLGIANPLPENVLVFGAGGFGDVPIPLLKGDCSYSFCPDKTYKVSFQGALATTQGRGVDVRQLLLENYSDDPDFTFLTPSSETEFLEVLKRSEFVLCPRGFGATSFRLYEAMRMGAIPIYVWEGVEWLPYREQIDWDELIVRVHYSEIGKLGERIRALTPEQIAAKQCAIREHHDTYFTFEGTCRYIDSVARRLG